MNLMDSLLEGELDALTLPLAIVRPPWQRIGRRHAAATIRLKQLGPLAHTAAGGVGKVAQDCVEDRLDFDGSIRDQMAIAAQMIGTDPTPDTGGGATLNRWREIRLSARSRARALAPSRSRALALSRSRALATKFTPMRSRCSSTATCRTRSTRSGSTTRGSARARISASPA